MRKNQDLNRLREAQADRKLKNIETLERNKPYIQVLLNRADRGEFPGLLTSGYNKQTHCLSMRFVALSAQWYAHKDECLVQEGNARARKFMCNASMLVLKLEIGRRGFMDVR